MSRHEEKSDLRDHLVRLFKRFDIDGNGLIDEQEFGNMLEALGWDSPVEMRSLEFAAIDSDADGFVRLQEFADWWLDEV